MAAVELSVEDAQRVLNGVEDRVSIAAGNSPNSTVLSGDPAALDIIMEQLRRDDIFCRLVTVDFAAHSPQMEPLRAELQLALAGLQPKSESVPIYSTVTGLIGHGADFDPPYWTRNMREPVLFSAAVQALEKDGHDVFLEISPHPILLGAINQGLRHFGRGGAALASLRREEDERGTLLGSLADLYTLGYPIDWDLIDRTGGECVPLPPYPWQRQRYWFEPLATQPSMSRHPAHLGEMGDHPLLGRHFRSPRSAGTYFWESALDRTLSPYLDDHRVEGVAVLPASVYLEMALASAAEVFGAQPIALSDIDFRRALFLPDGKSRRLQVVLARETDGTGSFHIYSRSDETTNAEQVWTLHATGTVAPEPNNGAASGSERETVEQMRVRLPEATSGQDYYRRLDERGVHYGPFFNNIVQIWRDDDEALGEMRAIDEPASKIGRSPPRSAMLDAGLQIFAAAAIQGDRPELHLPTHIGRLRIHARPGGTLWSHARVVDRQGNAAIGDVRVLDDEGNAAAEFHGVRFESLGDKALLVGRGPTRPMAL